MSIDIPHDGSIAGEPSSSPAPPKANPRNLPTKILSSFLVCVIMVPLALTAFLFILASLGFSFFFALYWFLHRNNRRHRLRRRGSSDGLSPRCVKSLPQFKFSEARQYGSDCVVCIDGFRQGQWCRMLPRCGHVFHRKCVDMWLIKVGTCPICRNNVRLVDKSERWKQKLKF